MQHSDPPADRPLALRVDAVIDGPTVRRGPEAVVLIRGGRIVGVGSPVPDDAIMREMPGCTALPGLVDTHVHLAFDATDDPVSTLETRDEAELQDTMIAAARRALSAGITTVRDLGDRGYAALTLRGRPDLPRILASGPPVTTPRGHCHFLGGGTPDTVEGVERAIAEHAERGVDVIKVMASGGNMTPGTRQEESQFQPEVLRALVEAAHRHGLPVTAHAHGTPSMIEALDAGVDGLEHVTFWSEDGIDAPAELMDRVARSGVPLGATLGYDPPGDFTALPDGLRTRLPRIHDNIARLRDAGAWIVAGTDAGVAPVKHHGVLPFAALQLAELGASPLDAIETITRSAARACGLGDVGHLGPGACADVLVVRGNPLEDLNRLRDVHMVVRAGQIVIDARPGETDQAH